MRKEESYEIEIEGAVIECRVEASLMPGVKRVLTGTTPHDSEIDAMSVPERPIWLALAVRALRWYRRRITPHLANRCVFEPSCSCYSELAFRRHGFLRGLMLTVLRLYRCRPGSGGVDLP